MQIRLFMQLPSLHTWYEWLAAFTAVYAVIMFRYFLIAGVFFILFHNRKKWLARKISVKNYPARQFRKEVIRSFVTGSIFSAAALFTYALYLKGYTLVYTGLNDYPLWWLPLSLLISMFIHESYYYWLHRWMHVPKVFRLVHKAHHDSNITSPWTAFSFHPLEGLLQALILPATLFIVPMHPYVLLIQLTVMTFSSVINHLNIEIYPKSFNRHIIGKWLIGATHHALHHKQFKYNFGLYFTFWDKWKSTESPVYDQLFEEKTNADRSVNVQ